MSDNESQSAEVLPGPAESAEGVGGVAPGVVAESPAAEGGQSQGAPPTEAGPQSAEGRPGPSKGAWPKSAIERVNSVTHKYRSAQEEIARLNARLSEFQSQQQGAPQAINPQTGVPFTPEEIDRIAWSRAQALAAKQSFDAKCDAAAERGRTRFSDWRARLDQFIAAVKDDTDPKSVDRYNVFLEAALETGEADAVIHRLGTDLDEARRVLGLHPLKMAMEVARIASTLGGEETRRVSGAPKPIRPLGSAAPASQIRPDDPERGASLSMNEWMKARSEQARERRIR